MNLREATERIRTDAGIAWLTGEIGKLLVECDQERSSRQAWAQEAMRLEMELEQAMAKLGAHRCHSCEHRTYDVFPGGGDPS